MVVFCLFQVKSKTKLIPQKSDVKKLNNNVSIDSVYKSIK